MFQATDSVFRWTHVGTKATYELLGTQLHVGTQPLSHMWELHHPHASAQSSLPNYLKHMVMESPRHVAPKNVQRGVIPTCSIAKEHEVPWKRVQVPISGSCLGLKLFVSDEKQTIPCHPRSQSNATSITTQESMQKSRHLIRPSFILIFPIQTLHN